MTQAQATVATFYQEWHTYQELLIEALTPLSTEQLALRPAPHLRSVAETALHIIGARARWFQGLGEGGERFIELGRWDEADAPPRRSAELVAALQATWQVMHEAIGRWTPSEWEQQMENDPGDEPALLTRHWIIWHLIEHDIHHGGELSITLGMHGIPALDL